MQIRAVPFRSSLLICTGSGLFKKWCPRLNFFPKQKQSLRQGFLLKLLMGGVLSGERGVREVEEVRGEKLHWEYSLCSKREALEQREHHRGGSPLKQRSPCLSVIGWGWGRWWEVSAASAWQRVVLQHPQLLGFWAVNHQNSLPLTLISLLIVEVLPNLWF